MITKKNHKLILNGIKGVHFKELITLDENGEVISTHEKGLSLPPGSQLRGRGDLSVLNHVWEWFPSPTGWLFCLAPHPAGLEVHCGFFLIGENPLYSPIAGYKVTLLL